MPDAADEATFTFSWLALKLLGRGLYSNPWSALSELVANGLDAGANDVYVYIDARSKSNATVEVIDNGIGMSRADISTYVKVGHNKRTDSAYREAHDSHSPMGRKGIGKLAALFLSQHFYLQTKHQEGQSSWELDARPDNVEDDQHPRLLSTESAPETTNEKLWSRMPSGTRLILTEVDLTGYGTQSMNALGSRLANQFLLPSSGNPTIWLWVQSSGKTNTQYQPVRKSIAFGNFVEVLQDFRDTSVQPAELARPPRMISIPAKGLPGDEYRRVQHFEGFPRSEPDDEAWGSISDLTDPTQREYKGFRYELTGWIGVHATIELKKARKNDSRFVKNKYYNPAQIRVYVRGKLASDRLLSQLGLTGTYANYIEGEISFDLLDEDDLPDIATSNRQDFDETDGRITLLRALVRPIVRTLIQRRNNLAGEINGLMRAEKERRDTASKRQFSEQLRTDLDQYSEIPEQTRDELQTVITNKIQGDVMPKEKYKVFISHARADRYFASFIDEVLRSRGVLAEEVFYTSRAGAIEQSLDERALGSIIRENITDANTLIFYMTSRNFLGSQFCLFEGGAGWATRGVTEYLKLNMDFESIPAFLTNGRSEMTIMSGNTIELTIELNNYIIDGILNPMIRHLNRGREISGTGQISPFAASVLPPAVEMSKSGKTANDYRDETLIEHWDVIVRPNIPRYILDYQNER